MTSRGWRQILLLALWDILCLFLNGLVTKISKLKKWMKFVYPLRRYNVMKFENNDMKFKNNFRGIRMGIGPIWGINSLTPSFSLDFSLCSGWLEVCPSPLPGRMTLGLCFSYSVVALDLLGSEDM